MKSSPRGWLPQSTDEAWAAHPEYLDETGQLTGSSGALLVERGERALLIDAGFGPQSLPKRSAQGTCLEWGHTSSWA
ncbi:hypothetical protein ABT009_42340 [Streptomyces sp. NPDC002896]|uniref:hypothetical protein n=1 Tax=Streptomyces sp. NPDC002896 TaxID=3154438 RepID=UPI00332A8EC7